MTGWPLPPVAEGHTAPVPRRVRGFAGGRQVFDTLAATYVWEWAFYPQFYVPLADVDQGLLVDEQHEEQTSRGTVRHFGLRVGDDVRSGAVQVLGADAAAGLADTARFDWAALDAWFEEDEQVFVHPRSPYVRVDALRSTRSVRVEIDGVVLAESDASVIVFETGLPPRYYLERTAVDFTRLVPSGTVTSCPYKGTTSGYWSATVDGAEHRDIAWSYDFPTRQLLPVTGLVAFLDEKVDTFVDGVRAERPNTHFG